MLSNLLSNLLSNMLSNLLGAHQFAAPPWLGEPGSCPAASRVDARELSPPSLLDLRRVDTGMALRAELGDFWLKMALAASAGSGCGVPKRICDANWTREWTKPSSIRSSNSSIRTAASAEWEGVGRPLSEGIAGRRAGGSGKAGRSAKGACRKGACGGGQRLQRGGEWVGIPSGVVSGFGSHLAW